MDLQNNIALNKIKDFLSNKDEIQFAYLFGSFNSKSFSNFSDVDLGIFTIGNLELLEIGNIIVKIESITKTQVDLLELNSLYDKNPLLSYNIISNGELLFSKNDNELITFKNRTFQSYFDTNLLRQSVNTAFNNRISNNDFGKRNYA